MSVQLGRWNLDGQPLVPGYFERVYPVIRPYGPDSTGSYSEGSLSMHYIAFHTTKESRRENQPHISRRGAVLTWDGRLDNRTELIGDLHSPLTEISTDLDIVATSYEEWGSNCFARFVGDWALAIWDPTIRSLLLAKDPVGTRHLYYSLYEDQISWSTVLGPLVQFAGRTFTLDEEYIAGWFSFLPAAHLTPYAGIHSVPPSSCVVLGPRVHSIHKYWDFDPGKRIRYRNDREYEEHFRIVFAQAVRRRLRSDRPILAELSGGIDSSSILSVADGIMARGSVETSRIDTISWYRNPCPIDDDRPFFTLIEMKRGCVGCHIDLACLQPSDSQNALASEFDNDRFAATPFPNASRREFFGQYAAYMRAQGLRVVLSGQAGEEATGGNPPTPSPELQGLLREGRILAFRHQLNAWAVAAHKHKLRLLWEAIREFAVPSSHVAAFRNVLPAPWFNQDFLRRNPDALSGYPARVKFSRVPPPFQSHMRNLDGTVRSALAYAAPSPDLVRELRYPYLDRDFLEFMYSIPLEQIVRPGQPRSLLKRALVGIVPDEILNRMKDGHVRRHRVEDTTKWTARVEMGPHLICGSMGIIDPILFEEALEKARHRDKSYIGPLRRTVVFESWLRHLARHGVITGAMATGSMQTMASQKQMPKTSLRSLTDGRYVSHGRPIHGAGRDSL